MGDNEAAARNADLAGLDESEAHRGDVPALDKPGPAICIECEGLCIPYPRAYYPQYLCAFSPREPRYSPVVGKVIINPQFYRCTDINPHGFCKLYRERKTQLQEPL